MDKKIKVRIYKYLDDSYSLVLERMGQDACDGLTNLQLEDIRQLAQDLTTEWAKLHRETQGYEQGEVSKRGKRRKWYSVITSDHKYRTVKAYDEEDARQRFLILHPHEEIIEINCNKLKTESCWGGA